ncbi:MAG TPA: GGDEF domain-containing protein [Sphingomicrobium sp.]|jgi:diguanylate cyclase (GGDEF)-like protein|nr:GGDEF domain-containing protein [Sphingomicrobium sp.]
MTDEVIERWDSGRLADDVASLQAEILQLRQRVEQLDALAHQDSLCDLPNRRGFMRVLERIIDRVKRYEEQAAMLFVDLDGLKMINDSSGHGAGDEALIQVSRLLVGGVRKSDLVARIGGDEFAILLVHADEESAVETASRLVDLIADCDFRHDGELLPLSVAIGVGMIHPEDTPEQAIARADAEMYRRKAA